MHGSDRRHHQYSFGCNALKPYLSLVQAAAGTIREHFPEKWTPVFLRKCDPQGNLEQICSSRRNPAGMSTVPATAPRIAWRTPAILVVAGCVISFLAFGPRSALGQFLTPLSVTHGWGR